MRRHLWLVLSLFLFNPANLVADSTESFRCGSMHHKNLVQLGNTEDYVLQSCGEPQSRHYDRWIYDGGRGDFIYTLRFKRGRLVFIDRGDRSLGTRPVSDTSPDPAPQAQAPKKPSIKDVDHVRVFAVDEDGVLRIDISYLNRDRDELVFWENSMARCVCKAYLNKGNLLKPTRGDLIGSVHKDVNRYDQDLYLDISYRYRSKDLWGIIECDVDTRYNQLHATANFHIK
ncbi:MAG TPA: DUF2845 domain-containing protein [Syntrophobacteraceae bacterium]|nr:DUF2845 domain-containing protein [Syntrophobacteraceae bacterium]